MSDLKTLIRAQKWKLDEQRRALADLHALSERLAEEKRRLEEDLLAEQAAARAADAGMYYGAYARQAAVRRRRLEQSIAQVAQQIEVATEQVAEAFQELKRYELAQEGRLRRERDRRRKRETALYDEIAVTGHLRRRRQPVE